MQMHVQEAVMENPDVVMCGNPNENSMRRDSSYLKNCNISAAYMSYGLYIQTETGTTVTASELGVKDIKVQQKMVFSGPPLQPREEAPILMMMFLRFL